MDNASLPSDDWDNVTTSASQTDGPKFYLSNVREPVLKGFFMVIGSVGVLCNLFVIVVFALYIKITNKTMNILVVNQSVIDLCASLSLLLTAAIEVEGRGLRRDSDWDQFVCRFWISRRPLWCMMVTSTYGILLTTLERYVAVVYPIWYSQHFRVKKRLVYGGIAFIWVFVPVWEIITVSVLSVDIEDGLCKWAAANRSYAAQKALGFFAIFVAYLLPLVAIIFCYSRIVYILRTKVMPATNSADPHKAGRNATVTSLLVCCGFIVCWSMNEVMYFLVTFLGLKFDARTKTFYDFTGFLVYANSCINPVIYAAKYREFQQGVRRMVSKQLQHGSQVAPNNT